MKILWLTTVISETLGWCPAIWVLTSPSDDSDTDMLELTCTIKEAFIPKFMYMNKFENKDYHKCYALSTSHAFSPYPGPENNALGESNDPNIGAKFIDIILIGDWLPRGAAPLNKWGSKPKGVMEKTDVWYIYEDPSQKLLEITWLWWGLEEFQREIWVSLLPVETREFEK